MTRRCFCGCGRLVSRTFAPGHDTKFVFDVLREILVPGGGATIGELLAEAFPEASDVVQQKNEGRRR